MPHREVSAAIKKVSSSEAEPVVALAFKFLVLTAARWSQVRWAARAKIDRTEGVWAVLAAGMKMRRDHRVPLCGRVVEIFEEARSRGGLVLSGGDGKPIAKNQLHRPIHKLEIGAVPHEFRSSFRDWATEETDHPREAVEAALAYVVQNRVEAAYRRTDLFERRRRLVDHWAADLAGAS